MNTASTSQNFRPRRNNNFKKGGSGGGGRQDFRRSNGGNNNGGSHNYSTHSQGNSNQARHPELDIVIDGKAAKRASTMRDKYQSMARDAQNNGDRVYAEYCNQHVDHYNRILNAFNDSRPQHLRQNDANTEGDENGQDNSVQSAEVVAIPAATPPVPLNADEEDGYQAASGGGAIL